MIFFPKTAERVDAGNPRNGPELGPDDPILYGPKIGLALKISSETLALRGEVAPIALPAGFAILDSCALAWPLIVNRPHVDLAKPG